MKFAPKLAVTAAALMTGLSGLLISSEVGAVPSFARQTGMACNTCHFQSYPILTAFGRSFKADGYLMAGSQGLIEGQDLSLPNTLNIAMVGKIRANWHKADSADGFTQSVEWPDELGMLIGGRLSENSGFLFELDQAGGEGIAGGKVHFNIADLGGAKLSVITFRGAEAGYGIELMGTGALGLQRPVESHNWSANLLLADHVGDADDAAGLTVAANAPNFMVSATGYSTSFGPVDGMATYFRGAYFADVAGWDVGVGAQLFTGGSSVNVDTGTVDADGAPIFENKTTDAVRTVFDAQAQGSVAGMPLGVYASFGTAPKASGSAVNLYNGTDADASAFGVLGQLWMSPAVALFGGYGQVVSGNGDAVANNEQTDGYVILGAKFKPAQNITIEAYNESHTISQSDAAAGADKTNSLLRLMLFAGF